MPLFAGLLSVCLCVCVCVCLHRIKLSEVGNNHLQYLGCKQHEPVVHARDRLNQAWLYTVLINKDIHTVFNTIDIFPIDVALSK
ncbi:hypothetical protein FKM82_002910 [Ascaphus truei]